MELVLVKFGDAGLHLLEKCFSQVIRAHFGVSKIINHTCRELREVHSFEIFQYKGVYHVRQLVDFVQKRKVFTLGDIWASLQMRSCLQDEEDVKVVELEDLTLVAKHRVNNFSQEFFVQKLLVS